MLSSTRGEREMRGWMGYRKGSQVICYGDSEWGACRPIGPDFNLVLATSISNRWPRVLLWPFVKSREFTSEG
jgi:hypothetical protein